MPGVLTDSEMLAHEGNWGIREHVRKRMEETTANVFFLLSGVPGSA